MAIIGRLRATRDLLAHRFNRRLVTSVAPDARLLGRVEVRVPGGTIAVGEGARVEGRLLSSSATSRLSIGRGVFIGRRTVIECFDEIVIEDDAMISFECIISDTSSHSLAPDERRDDVRRWMLSKQRAWMMPGIVTGPVRIGRDAWIGARVIILRGVSIGEGAIVGAGAVVSRDVPPFAVAAGNPARVIRHEDDDGITEASEGEPSGRGGSG